MASSIWQFAVLALLVVFLLAPANAAYNSGTASYTANETHVINYTNPTSLEADADSYDDSITVTNESGTPLSNGTDFIYDAGSGTIDWQDTAKTTEGNNATVEYGYEAYTDGSLLTLKVTELFGGLLGALLLVAGVLAAWNLGSGGGGL